jgi:hypothetical protein
MCPSWAIGFIICIVQVPCVRQLGRRNHQSQPEPALRSFWAFLFAQFITSISTPSPCPCFFPVPQRLDSPWTLDPQRAAPNILSLWDGSLTHSAHGVHPALRRCRRAVNHALCVWCILLLCRTL